MANETADRAPAPPESLLDGSDLAERLRWLVRLRWLAIGSAVAGSTTTMLLGIVDFSVLALLLPVAMALANLAFWRMGARPPHQLPSRKLERAIALQVTFDLTCLALLLHYSGGTDNPLQVLMVLPAAVAGMLLPLRTALSATAAGLAVHFAVVMAEFTYLLPHHPLRLGTHGVRHAFDVPLWQSPTFVAAHLVGLTVVCFGVLYFLGTLMAKIRETEARRRQHERIAASRSRFARIGSLAAGVAHSIRNPLHGLGNCVDMLHTRWSTAQPEDKEIIALMDEGVRRIERVTQRLLVLALDRAPQLFPADMDDVVQESLRFVDPMKRRRGVDIRFECADVPQVPLDVDRFTEALANVVDNAVDASADGGTVHVRVVDARAEANAIRIEVEDTGQGISPEDLGRVFDPFFTTKPVGEGTGLGLAITRRVVDDHGGSIRVDSQPGRGTKVCIELPVMMGAANNVEQP